MCFPVKEGLFEDTLVAIVQDRTVLPCGVGACCSLRIGRLGPVLPSVSFAGHQRRRSGSGRSVLSGGCVWSVTHLPWGQAMASLADGADGTRRVVRCGGEMRSERQRQQR